MIRAILGLGLSAFYARELWLWREVQAAPVSALLDAPNFAFSLFACLCLLASLLLFVFGRLTHKPADWRGFRVLPMLIVLVLALDFIVLSSVKSPLGTEARAKGALQVLTEGAQALATTQTVPQTEAELDGLLGLLGPVPWLVHGERPDDWQLVVRQGCMGPATDIGQAPVGTVLYCVSSDHRRAWLTLVGLPIEQKRGERGLVSLAPDWVGEITLAREDAEPDEPETEPEPSLDVDAAPTPDTEP